MCQLTHLQTEEDFVITERSFLEDTDFPLSSTFIDKNISEDSCSSCNQTESVFEENYNQTDMTVNHLKQLENELLGKNKSYYQLHEKIPCLMSGTLDWFDSDEKVLFIQVCHIGKYLNMSLILLIHRKTTFQFSTYLFSGI